MSKKTSVAIEVLSGTEMLGRIQLDFANKRLLAKALRGMADAIDDAEELTASDIRTILKLID